MRSARASRAGCGRRASRRARARSPRSAPRQPTPWSTWGLCGSPSRSEKAWCLRWSATHEITGPSIAAEPSTAQHEAQRARGLEAAVREEAVEADRYAERRQGVHDREHDQVGAVQEAVPELPADEAERGDRGERDERGDDPIAGLVCDRLDVVRAGLGPRRAVAPAADAWISSGPRPSTCGSPGSMVSVICASGNYQCSRRSSQVRRVVLP